MIARDRLRCSSAVLLAITSAREIATRKARCPSLRFASYCEEIKFLAGLRGRLKAQTAELK